MDIDKLSASAAVYVKATEAGIDFVRECTEEAAALVQEHIGTRAVPEVVARRAVVKTAANLYWQRGAQNGVATFGDADTLQTVRVGLDPMRDARAILNPFLGVAIA